MCANAGSVESSSRTYDVDSKQSLTGTIVEAVADVSGRPSVATPGEQRSAGREALEPLYHAIDPEALEALCSVPSRNREGDVQVSFTYHDCCVTVHSYGVVRVEAPESIDD